jgi:hypothetical protein
MVVIRMSDEELLRAVNKKRRMEDVAYGDYVRIVNREGALGGYAVGEVRMIHPEGIDHSSQNSVWVYMTSGDCATWGFENLEYATREEYVEFMRERGLTPRDE